MKTPTNKKLAFAVLLACVGVASCAKTESATTASPAAAQGAETQEAAASPATATAHALVFVPYGKQAPTNLKSKLSEWKADGSLSNVVLVKQYGFEEKPGYGPGFNELAVIDFADEAAFEDWKAHDAPALGPDVIASQVDVLLDKKSKKNDPGSSIFVVSQYESLVTPGQYQDYTDAYIEPNMANQMFSGIMTRYTMYLEREATGDRKNPKAVLVTEYANQAEYDRKASVKDAYKSVLLSGTHPEWARINDSKKGIRTDFSEAYANPVQL